MHEVHHQQAFDLGQDLLIAEAGAADRTGRAGCDTGATALAERRVDFADHAVFVEEDGVEGTHVVADAAAGAPVLVDRWRAPVPGRSLPVGCDPEHGRRPPHLARRCSGCLSDLGHSRR